jgi:hypothetical protein
MIQATVAIVAMAGLFVLFGTLRLADRGECGGGCAGCTRECEHHVEGGVS